MKDPHVFVPAEPKKQFKLNRKLVLITVIALAVLGLIIGGTYYYLTNRPQGETSKANDDAAVYIQKGDYEKALKILKAAESKPASKREKVELYSQIASVSMSAENPGQALEYYKKKHDLASNTAKEDALVIADYYAMSGDKEKAIEQYKLALEYEKTRPEGTLRNMNTSTINARLEELGAAQ